MRNVFTANGLLWMLQGILALFFALASGAPKLLLPAAALPMPIPLPQSFVWFIGACEVLGALGLVLPGLTHIQPRLTSLAAACLVLLTICAASYQLIAGQPANAVFALIIGALSGCVAYGRARGVQLSGSALALGATPTGP
ncbi:MAG: DoxX family protein [Chloroflexi bacterium]|nr:DoxX family protein [Chloroflexota bacterium]MBV9602186.1 DoxX family protein [Chloroflexota bacterium]